jgi:predicted phage terminase large subunit-like protein
VANTVNIAPQSGPQEKFLKSPADIAIFGGAAGGGKSYALLLEPLRHVTQNERFAAVFFRRTTTQITNPGGLWDASMRMYGQLRGVIPRLGNMEWIWEKGGKVKFSHLEHEQSKLNHQGAEYPLICCQEDEGVRMADGTLKAVRDIQVGDEVITLQGPRTVLFAGGRRKEQCVRAIVRDESGAVVGEQVHSDSHKVLGISGWVSYLDKKREDDQHAYRDSRQSRYSDKYEKPFQKKSLDGMPCFVENNQAPEPSDEAPQLLPECESPFSPALVISATPPALHPIPSVSTGSCVFCKYDPPSEQTSRSPLQYHDSRIAHLKQSDARPLLLQDCQCASESAACREQRFLGSGCGPSDDLHQEPLPLALTYRISVVLHAQSLRSVSFGNGEVLSLGEGDDAPIECIRGGCQCSYSSSPRLCGERPTILGENTLGGAQQLNDAGPRIPTDLPRDDRGIVRRDTLLKWSYSHPYRGSLREAEEGVVLGSCEMIPCGERWVIDLTIAGESHYITEMGLVNRNCFDELTHFSETQFWYLVSRNRSMSGVKGYVRATCNPDADSWVAKFLEWWIDQRTGLPIPERAGVLRWMIRVNDTLHWADSRQELIDQFRGAVPDEALMPKSVTFIPARLTDNQALMRADPGYLANLLSLQSVERGRLLDGNWKIRPSAGLFFQRRWLRPIQTIPSYMTWVRGWDLAATEKTDMNNPDFTESVLIGRTPDGTYVIADHTSMRGSPSKVEIEILRAARQDRNAGLEVIISIPQDPAQAGKAQAAAFARLLTGFTVRTSPESRSALSAAAGFAAKAAKIGRFGPFSAQCEAGNVYYVAGNWNGELFDKLEAFPEAAKDDAADACSRAFASLGENTYDSSLSWADALSELAF